MSSTLRFRTISARISGEDWEALAQLAELHDRSVSREIGRAIRFHLASSSRDERVPSAETTMRVEPER
jgi:hypothetical protein